MNAQVGIDRSTNPKTQARHRGQVRLQILLPVLAFALLMLALGVWAAVGGSNNQVAQWGNISAVLVILPFLVMLLVTLLVLAGLVFGVSRLLGAMPHWMYVAQQKVDSAGDAITNLADKLVQPVIKIRGAAAGARAARRRLFN